MWGLKCAPLSQMTEIIKLSGLRGRIFMLLWQQRTGYDRSDLPQNGQNIALDFVTSLPQCGQNTAEAAF